VINLVKGKSKIEEIAANMAKEIVVSKMSNTTVTPNAEGGKNVADFYAAIFDGISKTLLASSMNEENLTQK